MFFDATESSGTYDVDTQELGPSRFDPVLLDGDGRERARVGFVIRDPRAEISVSTDAERYDPGEPITVAWEDGPANRWDWIGSTR